MCQDTYICGMHQSGSVVVNCCSSFFFKQKTAYEIYQCDWSSDVCSSDLRSLRGEANVQPRLVKGRLGEPRSEERRVGEEGRCRWSADDLKKEKTCVK